VSPPVKFQREKCRSNFSTGGLEPNELRVIRVALGRLSSIEANDPRIRAIVARNRPHLLSKLPAEELQSVV
jgi:hypothetical protein